MRGAEEGYTPQSWAARGPPPALRRAGESLSRCDRSEVRRYALEVIFLWGYIRRTAWYIEVSDEFLEWYNALDQDELESVHC